MRTPPPSTAERIRASALALFAEHGYHGVSAREIALHAGVQKGLLFYWFGTKEELFRRVVVEYYAEHRDLLERAFAVDLPPRARMHGVVDAYLDYIAANRHFPRLVQQLSVGSGPPPEAVREGMSSLLRVTRAGLADLAPASGPTSAGHLHLTFFGAVVGFFQSAAGVADAWDGDPLSAAGIAERRAHLHWLVDVLVDALERDAG